MGRPALAYEVRRRFWREIRTGVVLADAAQVAGVANAVAWRWFREAGGVMRDATAPVPGVPRLSFAEREEISSGPFLKVGLRRAVITGTGRVLLGTDLPRRRT